MTIATHSRTHQWALADTQAEVEHGIAQYGEPRSWLRDEEARRVPDQDGIKRHAAHIDRYLGSHAY